jgi:CelD/BcsL family acetyltransferase involved in cellulose biosynthesis
VDIELVTDVDQLRQYVPSWDELADRVSQPRAGGAIVAAWARHMMPPGSELRVWLALDGSDVVGVLPLVAETMVRDRLRLLPPTTEMMFGTVPIALPDRVHEVVKAVAGDFALRSEAVDLTSIFWLPAGSPWMDALGELHPAPDWVTAKSEYSSNYTSIAAGMDSWLEQRHTEFRRTVRRRGRRAAEQGFRLFTTEDPEEIVQRLPLLQSFYLRRQEERGGGGYQFDANMMCALETTLEMSRRGRFALSVLENDDAAIGIQLVLRAGTRLSCWITGYDAEWSRLGPGIAAMLEALTAGAEAGCEIADLGVGDQPYKDDILDAAFPLESVTWCTPRLARLLHLTTVSTSVGQSDNDAEVPGIDL